MEFHGIERPLPRFAQQSLSMLVAGKPITAQSGRTFDVENPSTGSVFAQVPAAAATDVDVAVQAARESFELGSWRRMTAVDRERVMWKLSDLVETHVDE